MTLFFYILIGLITFGAFLHAWSKKGYDISRTIIINSPKAEVFATIRQLKKQEYWMPWFVNNPATTIKYKGEDGKVGASGYWKAKTRFGKEEGIQKITKVKDGKLLEIQLLFLKPYKSLSQTYMAVKEVGPERTKLVWGVRGVHRFPASVIMLFYGMDRSFGDKFEEGLDNLKYLLENK